jgi:Domain of unknown function (DUF4440)
VNRIRRAIFCAAVLVPAGAIAESAPRNDPLEARLVALEKSSWVAWKDRDGRFFEGFLSDDHLEVGAQGVSGKAQVVAFVASPVCVVESYSLGPFRFQRVAEDTAILTYRAEQNTACGGVAVPSPAWVTSIYVNRGGRWLNVLYQQTPVAGK